MNVQQLQAMNRVPSASQQQNCNKRTHADLVSRRGKYTTRRTSPPCIAQNTKAPVDFLCENESCAKGREYWAVCSMHVCVRTNEHPHARSLVAARLPCEGGCSFVRVFSCESGTAFTLRLCARGPANQRICKVCASGSNERCNGGQFSTACKLRPTCHRGIQQSSRRSVSHRMQRWTFTRYEDGAGHFGMRPVDESHKSCQAFAVHQARR